MPSDSSIKGACMDNLYLVDLYLENGGEIQGMFESDGTLIGHWSCDDALWRKEYFSSMMRALGYTVEYSENELLVAQLEAIYGS